MRAIPSSGRELGLGLGLTPSLQDNADEGKEGLVTDWLTGSGTDECRFSSGLVQAQLDKDG